LNIKGFDKQNMHPSENVIVYKEEEFDARSQVFDIPRI
jgi:hypothetical protein